MKRIYVAGAISDKNTVRALENISRGIRKSRELIKQGNAVFCPFIDFLYWISANEGEYITIDEIRKQSLQWLEVSDELYVLKGYEDSIGTAMEIEYARVKGIPIFYEGGV